MGYLDPQACGLCRRRKCMRYATGVAAHQMCHVKSKSEIARHQLGNECDVRVLLTKLTPTSKIV